MIEQYLYPCWWFSPESGRCMHKQNSNSPFKAWCGYKMHEGDHKQYDNCKSECTEFKPNCKQQKAPK